MGQGFNTFAGGLATGYQQGETMRRENDRSALLMGADKRQAEAYKKLGEIMDQWKEGKLPYQQSGPEQLAGPGGPAAPGAQPAAGGLASVPSTASPTVGGIVPNLTPQQQQKKALPFSDFMGFGQ